MDLVIRLKRPRNSDPIEALVLASKRRKKDSDADDVSAANESFPTILKFAGTLENQEEDISPHIRKARQRDGLKCFDRLKSKDVINKARKEAKKASKENRFKVVNFSRTASNTLLDHNYAGSENNSTNPEVSQYTIVDVVHPTESTDDQVEDDGYVYYLYYADAAGGDMNDGFMDSVISIEPLDMNNYPLYDYRDKEEEIIPDDEDDSNDENNWRNDYPDSDYDNERDGGDSSDESVEFKMEHLNLGKEAKKSWENLRDIFRRELKKMSAYKSGQATNPNSYSEYPYFRSNVREDVILPRPMTSSIPAIAVETEGSITEQERALKIAGEDIEVVSLSEKEESGSVSIQEKARQSSRKTKKRNYDEEAVEIEKETLTSFEKRLKMKSEKENDDYHFVMSILPYLQKLSDIQKIRVRMEIMGLVTRELELNNQCSISYPSSSLSTPTPPMIFHSPSSLMDPNPFSHATNSEPNNSLSSSN